MRCIWPIRSVFSASLAAAALLCPTGAAAHPHVWVTVKTEVVYDQQQAITGFRHQWTFDEFYSSFAMQGLDKNNDGKYDRAELQELAEVNVQSMKDFDYFTFPKVAGELLDRLPPKDYWLDFQDGKLILNFTLPLAEPLAAGKIKAFSLGVYDPTFYVEFALAEKDPVRLSAAPAGCVPKIQNPTPAEGRSGVASLSESYFNQLDGSSGLAEQYAKSVTITCTAS
jgi:ABC-type uncharacterized transport system substrate-binding protein